MSDIIICSEDFAAIEGAIAEMRANGTRRDRENLDRLEQELRRARQLPAEEMSSDVARLNSKVIVRDLDKETIESYRLVLPRQADFERRRLSVLAPVGAALLGYCKGDEVNWPVPGGVRKLRIESVEESGATPSDRGN